MKRGRRAETVETKRARGTYRPHRDDYKGPTLVVDNQGPVMPEFMAYDDPDKEPNPQFVLARLIWEKLHPKVTALGIGECDSNLFARYCLLEADVEALFISGIAPSMNKMTQLRQMEEMLRIGGPRSRITVKTPGPDANPFKRNGRRG
jgi:hypothetical protein